MSHFTPNTLLSVCLGLVAGSVDAETQTEFDGWTPTTVTRTVETFLPATLESLKEYAQSNALILTPLKELRAEVCLQIGKRLRHASSNDTYLAPAFFLRTFPKEAATAIYHFATPERSSNGRCLTWRCDQPETMPRFVLDLDNLPKTMFGCGRSRLLRIGRDRVARTMATIISLEVSHVMTLAGFSVLYVNFSYVIVQDNGEMRKPKVRGGTTDKVEIPLSKAEETRVRASAYFDLDSMADEEMPLSNAFLQLLGRKQLNSEEEEAAREEPAPACECDSAAPTEESSDATAALHRMVAEAVEAPPD